MFSKTDSISRLVGYDSNRIDLRSRFKIVLQVTTVIHNKARVLQKSLSFSIFNKNVLKTLTITNHLKKKGDYQKNNFQKRRWLK